MRLGGIGVGQAGGRILDLLAYHDIHGIHKKILPFAIAVNSAQADLLELRVIAKKDRILVGQTQVRGHGAGLIREVGAKVVDQQIHLIMRTIADKSLYRVDAFLLIAGLGGGTGSAGAPAIAAQLKSVYDQPVYVVGVIPSSDEGNLMTDNATAAIRELHSIVDGILLFDNDIWRKQGVPLQECYRFMNNELVRPIPFFMGAGEVSGNKVGVKVVDASDIMAAWSDLAYIGYSEMTTRTLPKRILSFGRSSSIGQLDPVLACLTVVKNAATLRLSGRCDTKQAKKALMLLTGPPRDINMEGFSQAKAWLQDYIGDSAEIRGGDYPLPRTNKISGTVLLSGFRDIPRLGFSLSATKKKSARKK